ncbi:MAG: heterodisulfide reductase [Candidatus Hydrothermota bacterium]|nr:MAG: heterodisulfide reductase [Candidatus Hydrothermae bacterium]
MSGLGIMNEKVRKVIELSGEDFYACYQCGRCTSGCPAAPFMDIMPNQITKYLQLGMVDELLESNAIWVCFSCYNCVTWCPKGVDIGKLTEALRLLRLRENIDYVKIEELQPEVVGELPPIALVGGFRKLTA